MKKGDSNNYIVIALLITLLIILLGLYITSIILNNRVYEITYLDNNNKYEITKSKYTIKVVSEIELPCEEEECPTTKKVNQIQFNNRKMTILNNFIKDIFKNNKGYSITISSNDLTEDQIKIIKSIIYDDEKYLE